jgi:hypothetical protein
MRRTLEFLLVFCAVWPLTTCVSTAPALIGNPRRLNSAPSQREIVRKSYEFALKHIGQDKDSGHIWHDYHPANQIRGGKYIHNHTLHTFRLMLLDINNMGRTTKNGCPSQSIPPRCPDPSRQR